VATVYYEKDADPKALAGKTIAVIGYGSQGHAHAQNLRDSGNKVIVGLAAGSKSKAKAEADGFQVLEPTAAAKAADVVVILAPDPQHGAIWNEIKTGMTKGKTLVVAHAFSVHFKTVQPTPDIDVVLIAPKGPGHRVREVYKEGRGVPALVAVFQDATGSALKTALAYGSGLGATRAGLLATTFKEEVETDLFGEQNVLCGGLSELIKAGYQTLVDAGYQPEVAYFECVHEVKLIVDLIHEGGLSYMRYSVSDTAEYGDYTTGPKIVDDRTRAEMKKSLAAIQDGSWAKSWIAEFQGGSRNLLATRAREQGLGVEQVGRKLRAMMPWIPKRDVPGVSN